MIGEDAERSGNAWEQWHDIMECKQPAGGCHSWEQAVWSPKCRLLVDWEANMDVSKNRGTPKSSILIGFSLINHPFWGTIIFGTTHIGQWMLGISESVIVASEDVAKGEAIQLYIPAIFAASEGWDGAVALALAGWVSFLVGSKMRDIYFCILRDDDVQRNFKQKRHFWSLLKARIHWHKWLLTYVMYAKYTTILHSQHIHSMLILYSFDSSYITYACFIVVVFTLYLIYNHMIFILCSWHAQIRLLWFSYMITLASPNFTLS